MQVVGQSFLFLHGRAAVHLHSQPVNGRVGTQGLQVWVLVFLPVQRLEGWMLHLVLTANAPQAVLTEPSLGSFHAQT